MDTFLRGPNKHRDDKREDITWVTGSGRGDDKCDEIITADKFLFRALKIPRVGDFDLCVR